MRLTTAHALMAKYGQVIERHEVMLLALSGRYIEVHHKHETVQSVYVSMQPMEGEVTRMIGVGQALAFLLQRDESFSQYGRTVRVKERYEVNGKGRTKLVRQVRAWVDGAEVVGRDDTFDSLVEGVLLDGEIGGLLDWIEEYHVASCDDTILV